MFFPVLAGADRQQDVSLISALAMFFFHLLVRVKRVPQMTTPCGVRIMVQQN